MTGLHYFDERGHPLMTLPIFLLNYDIMIFEVKTSLGAFSTFIFTFLFL